MGNRSGSPNKPKRALIALLQEQYPGYQPVLSMAKHAHELDRLANEDPNKPDLKNQAVDAHNKVAKYVTPQLKAVDVRVEASNIKKILLEDADD